MANYKKIFIIFLLANLLISPLLIMGAERQLEVQILGLKQTTLPVLLKYILAIFNFSLMVMGLVAFVALLYGGFRYLTSASNPAAIFLNKNQ
jgi:hypothetical protein